MRAPRWVFLGALLACVATAQTTTCNVTSFPVDLVDLQCYGLTPYAMATNEAECVQRCCDLGATKCSVWQYCPLVSSEPPTANARCARREARVPRCVHRGPRAGRAGSSARRGGARPRRRGVRPRITLCRRVKLLWGVAPWPASAHHSGGAQRYGHAVVERHAATASSRSPKAKAAWMCRQGGCA